MKKFYILLTLLLTLSLSLWGCGNSAEMESTEPSAEATQATEAVQETTAEPSIPQETNAAEAVTPTEPEPTEPDYTLYYDLLEAEDDGNALRDAMNCSFTTPQDMNLAYVFYGSLTTGGWDSLSAESVEALEAAGFNQNLELQIRPAKELEKALQENFGISLKDVKSGIPESWVYVKEDDCYYTNHSDALGFPEYTITWAEKISENRVELSYTIESDRWYDTATRTYLDHPNMLMVLELQEDGTYKMLSNYQVPSK